MRKNTAMQSIINENVSNRLIIPVAQLGSNYQVISRVKQSAIDLPSLAS